MCVKTLFVMPLIVQNEGWIDYYHLMLMCDDASASPDLTNQTVETADS